jgi:hypothetical protein
MLMITELLFVVFHLVEFIQSKTAAVVSSVWMLGNQKCCYPVNYSDSKVISAVKKQIQPNSQWEVFDVRIVLTKGLWFTGNLNT